MADGGLLYHWTVEMSVKIMGMVWDLKIDREEKFILLAYADHASHDGTSIYPAVSTIAEKTGYSERSVQLITRQLEEKGILVSDGKGPKGTNRWSIPISGGCISPEARGAKTAPVQEFQGEEKDEEGCKKEPKGVKPIAPESSLNVINPSIDQELYFTIWEIIKGEFDGDRYVPQLTKNRLAGTQGIRIDDRCLVVSAPKDCDWLNDHVKRVAERMLPGISAKVSAVEFVTS
jgi:hypothetical protein